jgi:ABC-type transport system involved in cytochrome bd biosynthesis fused ATPase/permease subunit
VATVAELARDKTVILATHSPALLALCDHVFDLEEGRLLREQVAEREEVVHV